MNEAERVSKEDWTLHAERLEMLAPLRFGASMEEVIEHTSRYVEANRESLGIPRRFRGQDPREMAKELKR